MQAIGQSHVDGIHRRVRKHRFIAAVGRTAILLAKLVGPFGRPGTDRLQAGAGRLGHLSRQLPSDHAGPQHSPLQPLCTFPIHRATILPHLPTRVRPAGCVPGETD